MRRHDIERIAVARANEGPGISCHAASVVADRRSPRRLTPSLERCQYIEVAMRTHHHGFYSYMLLSIALTSASACSWWDAEQGQVAQAVNPEPDPTTPIGQKWFKLGGKPVVGDAIAEVARLPVATGSTRD